MIDVSKAYNSPIFKYKKEEPNTPLYIFTQNLITRLHISVLEKILANSDFNQEIKIFELKVNEFNDVFLLLEKNFKVKINKINSIEFSFNEDTYMLNVLISGEKDVLYFRIKVTEELFIDAAQQLEEYLNKIYKDDIISLDYKRITRKLSGEHTTINLS